MLVFDEGMKQMLKDVFTNYEGDTVILAKSVKIIRKDIIEHELFYFEASFPPNCQENSIPTTLKMLVSTLLNGPDMKNPDSQESKQTLTISKAIMFNYKKETQAGTKYRHIVSSEPLYVGLNVYTLTRSKKLIKQLHHVGFSVSYSRIIRIENQLTTTAYQKAQRKGFFVHLSATVDFLLSVHWIISTITLEAPQPRIPSMTQGSAYFNNHQFNTRGKAKGWSFFLSKQTKGTFPCLKISELFLWLLWNNLRLK